MERSTAHQPTLYWGYTKRQLIIAGVVGVTIFLLSSLYINQYHKAQEIALRLDTKRGCDLAKIQFALEEFYEHNQQYPPDVYNQGFTNFYRTVFRRDQDMPRDPQGNLEYAYNPSPPESYLLAGSLSNGNEVRHEPAKDFPGKNVSIKKGKPIPVDKSHYEVPCSLLSEK